MTINAVDKSVSIQLNADGNLYGSNPEGDGVLVTRSLTTSIDAGVSYYNGNPSYCEWTTSASVSYMKVSYYTDALDKFGVVHTLADRNQKSIYIKFWRKQKGDIIVSSKNLKIFGQNIPNAYSNTTFAPMSYNDEWGVQYGDSNAASAGNDTTISFRFDGTAGGGSVFTRATPTMRTAISRLYLDDKWHEWGYHVRFNDNGTANGRITVIRDDVTLLDIVSVFNRADGHAGIDKIGIGQYAPSTLSCAICFRDLRISHTGWPKPADKQGNYV